jgi:2-amino-4-hydroxy-6-hydroxymethyldihydropteridine diphosphokinase
MPEVAVYVGLGSNLEDPQMQVRSALDELAGLPRTRLRAHSSLYISAPMGPQDQPDFVNAVACLETALRPEQLLRALQAIEQSHRRQKSRHWGPRTLDLDILLYGHDVIDSEHLKVPHPGIAQRNFVLYPLAEIDCQLDIPGVGKVQALLDQCSDDGLRRLAAEPRAPE